MQTLAGILNLAYRTLAGILILAYISGTNSSNGQGGKERKDSNLLSLVLFTNRPGAWDIALHSLAAQTSRNYELIVVDDTKADRRDTAILLAAGGQTQTDTHTHRHTHTHTPPDANTYV
jgi:hypothetical protein